MGEFSTGIFSLGRELSSSELSSGNFTIGKLARIPVLNSLYFYYFVIVVSILHEAMFRGNFELGWNCMEDFSVGENIL